MSNPKVFISYSWKPILNKKKVLELAERLQSEGVHVILDEWDLSEGQDKYVFMEKMVTDPEVYRVLLICNKEYALKADERKGGVGVESTIISKKVYDEVDQKKFIPVIFEFDDKGDAYLPTFVKSRIFIDLVTDDTYAENHEKLLRNIYDKPANPRPPLGTMPKHLDIEESLFLPTARKVATIKIAFANERKTVDVLVKDYLNTVVSCMQFFKIDPATATDSNIDILVWDKITEMKPLRDDFSSFMEVYLKFSLKYDKVVFHSFLEQLLEFLSRVQNASGYLPSSPIHDQYRFFYYELFLIFSTSLLRAEKFEDLAYHLNTNFLLETPESGSLDAYYFDRFRRNSESLNRFRKKRLQLQCVSVTAELMMQRAESSMPFKELRMTDLLLHYLTLLQSNTPEGLKIFWFPETASADLSRYNLLKRTISKRYFERVKCLFGVENKQALEEIIKLIQKDGQDRRIPYEYNVYDIKTALAVPQMCTVD